MSISLILPMRASVRRGTTQMVNGSQQTVWSTIHTNLPCLWARTSAIDSYMDTKTATAKSQGITYFEPDADIKAGDSLTIAGLPGTYVLQPDGGVMYDEQGQPHHIEYVTKQTA